MSNFTEKSNIPELIPIQRIEGDHTHYLGITDDGKQFWGYETFFFSKPYGEIGQNEDWRKFRKVYLILHLFDKLGNHMDTKYNFAGTTLDVENQDLGVKLNEMLNELGDFQFSDIKVKTFKITIDGVDFGLITNEEFETVDLEPSSTISFQEPWDGEYFT